MAATFVAGTFPAADGTRLAYHAAGTGDPLVCLPGGPMQASAYLGDLGGLAARRRLVRLDLRGTGDSAAPEDPATYRCDRLVGDVEALRLHLRVDQLDLLGHSAGGTLAILYAVRYPQHVRRLVLVTPSPRAVGLAIADADRRGVVVQRHSEAWFPDAFAAFERIWAREASDADWSAVVPFNHGRWDDAARRLEARRETELNAQAAAVYYAEGAVDPAAVRSSLVRFEPPVLVLAGELDPGLPPVRAAEYAHLFRRGELAVQPGAGHNPWLDDGDWFTSTVARFLDQSG